MDTIDEAVSRKVARMIYMLNLVYFITLLPFGGLALYELIAGANSFTQTTTTLFIFLEFLATEIVPLVHITR